MAAKDSLPVHNRHGRGQRHRMARKELLDFHGRWRPGQLPSRSNCKGPLGLRPKVKFKIQATVGAKLASPRLAPTSEPVERRDQSVLGRKGLRPDQSNSQALHRRSSAARTGTARPVCTNHELISTLGAGVRSPSKFGIFTAQSISGCTHSRIFQEPKVQAHRVPLPRSGRQPLFVFRGPIDGRSGRNPQ